MNHRHNSFVRKIAYIAIICLLLIPLAILGQPATRSSSGDGTPGGALSKMRSENGLAQTSLGEIDPASETMKLASLGLRGVASIVLWSKANEYKKKKNWDQLSVTLNQIIKIQPNFMSVWEFQAHNLSYNVSAEFDDYEYRYHWVKKGMYFLMQGIAFNRRDHRILSNLGWFFGQKLGRADERQQFRRIFRRDRDFHEHLSQYIVIDQTNGPEGPDNWLVAHQWDRLAEQMVRNENVVIRGKSPLMFYSMAASQLRNYADDLEQEYRPNEVAQRAWLDALAAWRRYGNEPIRSSIGTVLVLNEEQEIRQRIEELRDELDSLVPGVREQLRQETLAELSPDELAALDKSEVPEEVRLEIENDPSRSEIEKRLELRRLQKLRTRQLSLEEEELSLNAQARLDINVFAILERVDDVAPENSSMAHRVALEIADAVEKLQWVELYRSQVNYSYWEVRCFSESRLEAIEARAALYDAIKLQSESTLEDYVVTDPDTGEPLINPDTGEVVTAPGAITRYMDAFELWGTIYDRFPDLVDYVSTSIMIAAVENYYRALQDVNGRWPLDFPLQFMVDRYAAVNETDLPDSRQVELMRQGQVQLQDDGDSDGDSDGDGSDR